MFVRSIHTCDGIPWPSCLDAPEWFRNAHSRFPMLFYLQKRLHIVWNTTTNNFVRKLAPHRNEAVGGSFVFENFWVQNKTVWFWAHRVERHALHSKTNPSFFVQTGFQQKVISPSTDAQVNVSCFDAGWKQFKQINQQILRVSCNQTLRNLRCSCKPAVRKSTGGSSQKLAQLPESHCMQEIGRIIKKISSSVH